MGWGQMRMGRRKGRRTEEGRKEVWLHLRGPQAMRHWTLAHYASFLEDWTILVLVLKVCDSKASVFPRSFKVAEE